MSNLLFKQCTKCHNEQSIEEFGWSNKIKGYRRSRCKMCTAIDESARQSYKRAHQQTPKGKATSKRYYTSSSGKLSLKKSLLKRYGITLEEYNQMFEKQNSSCAICGKRQSELKRALAVDHNHKSGEVRALLCTWCNSVLGHAKDSEELLLKIVEYLRKFGRKK